MLIDLKRVELTHQDLGQMQMYVNYNDRYVKTDDELPTIGIVLCVRKNDAVVPDDATGRSQYLRIEIPALSDIETGACSPTGEHPERIKAIGKAQTMNSGQGPMGSVLGDGRRALSEEVLGGLQTD